MFRKLLIPTDGSTLSEKSSQAALAFAAATGASVVGLSVAQLYPFMLMPEAGAMVDLGAYEEIQDKTAQQAMQNLQAMADLMMVGGHIDMPPIGAYTIGFFFFWSFGALASMLSLYLVRSDTPAQPPF